MYNLRHNSNDADGFLRKGYINSAQFLGFSSDVGRVAFSAMDLTLSAYGLSRMVLRPDAWRLFRYLPSDFVKSARVTGAPSLALEGIGDLLTMYSISDKAKSAP